MDNWDVLATNYLLETPWVKVVHDRLRQRASGEERDYYYLTSPGEAVATVALTGEGCVLLTRQYRHPLRRIIWDLPAGAMRSGENPAQAARRELLEETGYRARELVPLAYFNQFPGSMNIGTHLFLAQGLTWVGQRLDPGEELEVVPVPFGQVLEMVLSGGMIDGSLMLGVLLVAQKGITSIIPPK
jgi:ADP-ribose pyrophosphatase